MLSHDELIQKMLRNPDIKSEYDAQACASPSVLSPVDDIVMWIEQGSSIHIKAISKTDPVELSVDEARAVVAALSSLVARLDESDRGGLPRQ